MKHQRKLAFMAGVSLMATESIVATLINTIIFWIIFSILGHVWIRYKLGCEKLKEDNKNESYENSSFEYLIS